MPTLFRTLALLALLCPAAPCLADEIYAYGGRVRYEYFDYQQALRSTRPLYVLLDLSTTELTVFRVDPATKSATRFHGDVTSWPEYPFSPQRDRRTRTFVYADNENSSDNVNFRRLRATAAPRELAISSGETRLLPRKLAYSSFVRLSTLLVEEEAGRLSYLAEPTKAINDGALDLAGAETALLDYLRARRIID